MPLFGFKRQGKTNRPGEKGKIGGKTPHKTQTKKRGPARPDGVFPHLKTTPAPFWWKKSPKKPKRGKTGGQFSGGKTTPTNFGGGGNTMKQRKKKI